MNSYEELYHHGILGQKWGVRRYQNKDGTYTQAGKRRRAVNEGKTSSEKSKSSNRDPERAKKIAKYAVAGALGAAAITTAAIYVKQHPEVAFKVSNMKTIMSAEMSDLKVAAREAARSAGERAISKGKNMAIASKFAVDAYKENAINGFKQGLYEGVNEAPKKLGKTLVVGTALVVGKKYVDKTLGKETSAKIFQANNSKKIDKFWKVNDERDKDDD